MIKLVKTNKVTVTQTAQETWRLKMVTQHVETCLKEEENV